MYKVIAKSMSFKVHLVYFLFIIMPFPNFVPEWKVSSSFPTDMVVLRSMCLPELCTLFGSIFQVCWIMSKNAKRMYESQLLQEHPTKIFSSSFATGSTSSQASSSQIDSHRSPLRSSVTTRDKVGGRLLRNFELHHTFNRTLTSKFCIALASYRNYVFPTPWVNK